MNTKKIVKIDQDTALAWAFHFMGRDYMPIDEFVNDLDGLLNAKDYKFRFVNH